MNRSLPKPGIRGFVERLVKWRLVGDLFIVEDALEPIDALAPFDEEGLKLGYVVDRWHASQVKLAEFATYVRQAADLAI